MKSETAYPTNDVYQDESGEPEFTPLTATQAQALRERDPSISPWRVVIVQVLVGTLVALAAWVLTGKSQIAVSAAYGALAVVIPAALFARGLKSRLSSANAASAVLAFVLWELVKIFVTLAMLMAAPRLIDGLSWLAMLAGLVLTMKVYWIALLFRKKSGRHPRFQETSNA